MTAQPAEVGRLDDDTAAMVNLIMSSLEDTKAHDLVTIDVRGRSSNLFDLMIICTATSSRHAAALADRLRVDLKCTGFQIHGFEGPGEMGWTLLDAGAVIVHIFLATARTHYDLESLWGVPAQL